MKNIIITLMALIAIIWSCTKKHEPAPITKGFLKLTFDNQVGNEDLVLDSKKYLNANGDTFSVSLFKYYISNVKLRRKSDQVWVSLPANYNLIEEEVKSSFTIGNIDAAVYDNIQFYIGLDSATNFGSNFNGDLNTSNGMYWEWMPQFVFLKFEGKNYYSNTNRSLVFHIAGNSNVKTIQLPLSKTLNANSTLEVKIKTDAYKLFDNPTKIDFSNVNNVMSGTSMNNIAQNYEDMFSIISETIN